VRRVVFSLVFLVSFAALALAKLSPLKVKDVSLMLRSGYSVEAVEKDLAVRHFIEVVGPEGEKALALSGATPALIAALKSGTYAVPAQDVAAVQKEMEANAQRRALLAEESKRQNTLYQDQLARTRAATPPPAAFANMVATMVKGSLVTSRNGLLSSYNDQTLENKKLIGLYFSAHWCPSCRKFTPDLVDFYKRVSAAHPEFEIVFVSCDRSAPAMETYMRDLQMPWPAVTFDKVAERQALMKYAGAGIPCLVVVDAQGKVVSDTYNGETYLGPKKVLDDLDRLFAPGAAGALAQSR
jgi:nucleoredoxin